MDNVVNKINSQVLIYSEWYLKPILKKIWKLSTCERYEKKRHEISVWPETIEYQSIAKLTVLLEITWLWLLNSHFFDSTSFEWRNEWLIKFIYNFWNDKILYTNGSVQQSFYNWQWSSGRELRNIQQLNSKWMNNCWTVK